MRFQALAWKRVIARGKRLSRVTFDFSPRLVEDFRLKVRSGDMTGHDISTNHTSVYISFQSRQSIVF